MHCSRCLSDHSVDSPCTPVPRARHGTSLLGESHPHGGESSEQAPPGSWDVWIRHPEGVSVHGMELGKGGLFLSCAEPFPALFTRLELTLRLAGEEFACEGEVVRHVDSAHARTWGVSAGIGVQLLPPSPQLRDFLSRARHSRHEDGLVPELLTSR
ncbi:hypothetical protein HUW62_05715 [Myxococcus sp. AM011]|uniref:PilZ domain-containing protein n=1 Tax=Myxococcus sp. AM011 TaxID=2745200 RepID=UPI00159623CC|nr:PilZ domain-containing protein [Myxococcus sp. AM011]NVJ20710.1 hypothetical protein [Myxococcus sp. AM011]